MATFTYSLYGGRSGFTKERLPAELHLVFNGTCCGILSVVAEIEVETDFHSERGFEIVQVDIAPDTKGEPWKLVEPGDDLMDSFEEYVSQPHIAREICAELAERAYERQMEGVFG